MRSVVALVGLMATLGCDRAASSSSSAGGGGSGASTTTTTTGAGAAGGQGGQGGAGAGGQAACVTPQDCGTDDTCVTYTCSNAVCGTVAASKGTPCLENSGNVCSDGACVAWAPLSVVNAPAARSKHTMVWSGDRVLLWGGRTGAGLETASGHLYDPATDSWTPMSSAGAPSARHSHVAVWTGTEMLVWGGFGDGVSLNDGAAYNPTNDTWRGLPAVAVAGRTDHVVEWTGSEMLVWGGRDGAALLSDGARYNVSTDTWGPIAPFPLGGRFNVISGWVAAASGLPEGAMVIWGGSNFFDWLSNGAFWDPSTNSWSLISDTIPANGTGPDHALEGATSLVLGPTVYIWGGWDGGNHYDYGYFLDMSFQDGGYWYLIPSTASTLSARRFHVGVRSKKSLAFFVWGGCADSSCAQVFADGGYWSRTHGNPDDPWIYVAPDPALTARSDTAMINTGDEVILWGGLSPQNQPLGDGARRLMPDPP